MSLHHYECVAPCLANILQKGRFWAASLASVSSMLNDKRSSEILQIQVEHVYPNGLVQFFRGCSKMIRQASADVSIRATCPKREWRHRRDLAITESGWSDKSGHCSQNQTNETRIIGGRKSSGNPTTQVQSENGRYIEEGNGVRCSPTASDRCLTRCYS